jgi:hypothetical protein
LPDRGEIRGIYKKMGIHKDDPDEKVLVLSVENLLSIYPRLYEYMQLNPFDTEYPSQGKIRTDSRVIKDVRERVSVSRWDRDRHFREEVLASYNNKCAICRCQEISLLQAAHIEPVACGGNDDKSNGISLCANHHLMLDNGLIEIDFMTRRLSYVEDTVKKMPWYEEFNTKYQGKIMEQQ